MARIEEFNCLMLNFSLEPLTSNYCGMVRFVMNEQSPEIQVDLSIRVIIKPSTKINSSVVLFDY